MDGGDEQTAAEEADEPEDADDPDGSTDAATETSDGGVVDLTEAVTG